MEQQWGTKKTGLESLVDHYRMAFRIPENLNHYSEKDFRSAEKQYLRYCIRTGDCNISMHVGNLQHYN
ncbi:MAG: hypothetical protein JRH15_13655 [Deltaproteobacteria bacterium]|nr:hypothetical protein [Deltaproteobacteria bacterium]